MSSRYCEKDSEFLALVRSGVGVQPYGGGARVSHKVVVERQGLSKIQNALHLRGGADRYEPHLGAPRHLRKLPYQLLQVPEPRPLRELDELLDSRV